MNFDDKLSKELQLNNVNLDSGAIISRNIALGIDKILYAQRDDPISPEDSGWQFTAGSLDGSNMQNAEIWTLREIIELEPTLAKFISLPIGSGIVRSSSGDNWRII